MFKNKRMLFILLLSLLFSLSLLLLHGCGGGQGNIPSSPPDSPVPSSPSTVPIPSPTTSTPTPFPTQTITPPPDTSGGGNPIFNYVPPDIIQQSGN